MRSVFATTLSVFVLTACSSNEPPPATTTCTTIADLQAKVFTPTCAKSECHSADATGQSGLDLESPGVEQRLVGKAGAMCEGQTLVVPGDPESSWLYRKVVDEKPACDTEPMPDRTLVKRLSASDLACIRGFILNAKAPPSPADGGVEDTAPTVTCSGAQTACGGVCVDTASDGANCGMCGKSCGAQFCAAGVCSDTCPGSTAKCGSSCIDLQNDAANCGACGKACTGGQVCTAGTCACGGALPYSTGVQPILTANCTDSGCHAGTRPAAKLDLRSGRSWAALVGVASSACSGKQRVVAGNVDQSYLMNKLTGSGMCAGSQMPKAGTTLASSDLATIKAWICNGAKND